MISVNHLVAPLQEEPVYKLRDLVAFIEYSFHALFSFFAFANLFNMLSTYVGIKSSDSEVLICPFSILRMKMV